MNTSRWSIAGKHVPPIWRCIAAVSIAIPLTLAGVAGSHASDNSQYAALFAQLRQGANQHVIVMMRNQHNDLAGRANLAARNSAIHADQAPILSELAQVANGKVNAFHVINAIEATVSTSEEAHLRANPAVQSVVPDMIVKPAPAANPATASSITAAGTTVIGSLSNLCGTAANPIQNEALSLTNDLVATQIRTSQGAKIDGTGVKVAYIADGIDPNNVEFIRKDGSHVITDYEDFNGDGTSGPGGEEAFGDASMIAAQGNQAYDISNYSGKPLGHPCYIKVQGMAPGASIIALKVFGANAAFSGVFIRAIQYAVDNGSDVLNESFGGNPYPNFGNDPISLADAAAIADGTTITVSSGDAGTTETLGSPSTLQDVIESGATTDLRSEEQVDYPGTGMGTGWLSNEISPFSSGGISQNGQRTIDAVAPGNSDWAACTACPSSLGGVGTFGVVLFGGTSESSPITAGEAALIIQAYRSTHNGANPSPGEVKQIIKSTSTNLDYPSDVQGAGFINAQKAVQQALSLPDSNGTPNPVGDSILWSAHAGTSDPASTLFAQAAPNTPVNFSIQATNTGVHSEIVHPYVKTLQLGAPQNFLVNLGTSHSFTDTFNRLSYEQPQTFTVPVNQQYMSIQFAWPNMLPYAASGHGSRVRMTLFDPSGRNAIYSRPQGSGQGWGNVEIHDPQAGTWTAEFWTISPTLTSASYLGPVHMTLQYGNYVATGSALPSGWSLQVGQTSSFNVHLTTPATPGDQSVEVVLSGTSTGALQSSVIPINLRSFINPVNNVGNFGGIILGGNGRPGAPGDTKAYNFRVPAGTHDISLGIKLNDSNFNLQGVLVDPAGNPVDDQTTVTTQASNFNITGLTNTMQFFWANPQPGLWTYVQFVNLYASGGETQEPFTGKLQFNGVKVTLTGMPTAASPATAGGTFVADVHITNTGNEVEHPFVDPRTLTQTVSNVCCYEGAQPFAAAVNLVPPETTQVASWTTDISGNNFDTELLGENGQAPYGGTGIPDVMGVTALDPAAGGYASNAAYGNGNDTPVPAGFYYTVATLVGPFGASGGPTNSDYFFDLQYTSKGFDSNVCPSNGDFWADNTTTNGFTSNTATGCGSYSQLNLYPGQTVVIQVTFTVPATAASGSTVSGQLDADTIVITNFGSGILNTGNGDVMAQLKYSYPVA